MPNLYGKWGLSGLFLAPLYNVQNRGKLKLSKGASLPFQVQNNSMIMVTYLRWSCVDYSLCYIFVKFS